MEIDSFIANLDPNLFKLSYLIIAIFIVCFGLFIDGILCKIERERVASKQRDQYYQNLTAQSEEMERKKTKDELQAFLELEKLKQEEKRLRKLAESNGITSELSSISCKDLEEQKKRELHNLEKKAKELDNLDGDITRLSHELAKEGIIDEEMLERFRDEQELLSEKITCVRSDKEQLEQIINGHKENEANVNLQISRKSSNLDPKTLKFLDDNPDELTLDSLVKAHETLLEIKASNPEIDLEDYIKKLRQDQANYATELAELRVRKKEAEIKLHLTRQKYNEQLNSFNELKVEHILKNHGASEYLAVLKEKNKVNQDIITNLKKELESKREELEVWKERYQEEERTSQRYRDELIRAQVQKEEIEAKKRVLQESGYSFILNQSSFGDLHSNSSHVEALPPPPPVEVPSVDELLRYSTNLTTPMTPVHASAGSISSERSQNQFRAETRAKIGGSYGRMYNSSFSPG